MRSCASSESIPTASDRVITSTTQPIVIAKFRVDTRSQSPQLSWLFFYLAQFVRNAHRGRYVLGAGERRWGRCAGLIV